MVSQAGHEERPVRKSGEAVGKCLVAQTAFKQYAIGYVTKYKQVSHRSFSLQEWGLSDLVVALGAVNLQAQLHLIGACGVGGRDLLPSGPAFRERAAHDLCLGSPYKLSGRFVQVDHLLQSIKDQHSVPHVLYQSVPRDGDQIEDTHAQQPPGQDKDRDDEERRGKIVGVRTRWDGGLDHTGRYGQESADKYGRESVAIEGGPGERRRHKKSDR